MAKMKKKGLSDLKNKKSLKRKQSSTNPFEVHVNKQKFHVLGRKMKQDRGLPGLARAKSIKKRKETLLQEYKVKDKANKFLDRRIGENNVAMTKEDRILARFTAERLKSHKRKGMFNLGEDEVLTHKGRSLAEIETFENPSSDEDEDVDQYSKGKLDANFVEEAHFGGGLFKKADESKGRAAIIDQLIAESKKRKAEKQEAKEKTLEKTEQLDTEWRELMPMVAGSGSGPGDVEPVEKKDPYDLLMSQLRFEARGTPSDRLKSESELVAEEARRLRELEEERLRRMRGDENAEASNTKGKSQHRSADDLDDGFQFEQEEEFQVIYDKDGKLISKFKENEDKEEKKEQYSSKPDDDNDMENDDDSEEEEEEGDEEEHSGDGEESDGQEDNNDKEDNSDSEGEGIFDLSDMKNTEKEEASEEELEVEEHLENVKSKRLVIEKSPMKEDCALGGKEEIQKKKVAFDPVVKTIEVNKTKNKSEEQLKKEEEEKRKLMEQARSELPFTFELPETYDQLFELMEDKSEVEQAIIVERMIKCNHPSLNEKNKTELNKLFAFLLQFLNDAQHLECWILLDHMAPFLYELTKFSPSNAAYSLAEVLKEKHSEFLEKKHRYPSTETLTFLKLVPLLFPTSDKRHPVTTPSLVFITEMLRNCRVTTRRAIATGLFLVTLFTQYVNLSKRILPEAINFLCGIIHLATPISSKGLIVPPFLREHKFLYLQNPCTHLSNENLRMLSKDLSPKSLKVDDEFRVRSVFVALNLIEILIELWKDISGSWLLLNPVMDHISALEVDKYPNTIGKTVQNIKKSLNEIKNKGFEQVVKQERKPKALRLYDPKIQPVYENRKRKLNDEKSEQKRLLTKYKREMKGALREIRRDRTFLANVKFKEIAKSDAERMKKVKEIYSWGTQQQAELNKLARQKRRRK